MLDVRSDQDPHVARLSGEEVHDLLAVSAHWAAPRHLILTEHTEKTSMSTLKIRSMLGGVVLLRAEYERSCHLHEINLAYVCVKLWMTVIIKTCRRITACASNAFNFGRSR